MPGKILRVESVVGQKVKTGQVLVVMEAMKMEYTLTSAMAGEVSEVACQAGDQVKLGQALITLKED
jgi:biotin carboxyl carrier protein